MRVFSLAVLLAFAIAWLSEGRGRGHPYDKPPADNPPEPKRQRWH